MRALLRAGTGALLAVTIMALGSLGLWIGTPLLWLWVGSRVDGDTESLSLALVVMGFGVLVTVWIAARVLAVLSNRFRANQVAQGRPDPGHKVLETVLIVTAGIAIVVFGVWFVLFAGGGAVSLGPNL